MKARNLIPEIMFLLSVVIYSCNEIPQIGIIKDTANGITTTYKNLKPTEVFKVMNGEQFDHIQIPLGESFEVINDNVHGLTEKDDMVQVGCELTISDKTGIVLLHMDDLFENSGLLPKDSAQFLRCTVNTGAPMKWQEKYDVAIRYWDKYGDGELENNLEIEIIDEP